MSKKWIHVRPQRETLEESMWEHDTIRATQESVNEFFACDLYGNKFTVEPYDSKPDTRIDWPCTWIVMGPYGPVGFASGDVGNDDPTL